MKSYRIHSCVWLLSMLFLTFIHAAGCISSWLRFYSWVESHCYGYTAIYLSTHLLTYIWVVSRHWLLWINLLWTFRYKSLCRHVFISFWYIPSSEITGSFGKCNFNFIQNCRTVFQNGCTGCTMIHSHQNALDFQLL